MCLWLYSRVVCFVCRILLSLSFPPRILRPQSSFFFLVIRRPPRSTPFPTRRSSDLSGHCRILGSDGCSRHRCISGSDGRSEEHTSELQSLRHLVCRLLLEKKN